MVSSSVLGFPRMGRLRDLKKANEAYWADKLSQQELLDEGKRLRLEHWKIQKDAGVDIIPSNDFAFYDHVLDHIQMFNAIPERYSQHKLDPIDQYFAMGRGHQKGDVDVPSLEMVKWFDSNYHYVKPTLQDNQTFKLASDPKPIREFLEAKEAGITTRPVIVGPVSFLALGKADRGQSVDPISLLDSLLPVYVELLEGLKKAGAETVQIDEPVLVFDLPQKIKDAFKPAYEKLSGSNIPQLVLATYFGDIVHNFDVIPAFSQLYALHVDLVRHPEQLESVIGQIGDKQTLSCGVVDGRNIWKTNFKKAIELVETAVQKLGKERVIVATSSSLLHVPHTLDSEKKLPEEVKDWFSFAVQKASEVTIIAKAVTEGPASVREQLEANAKSMEARASSKRTNVPEVKERQSKVSEDMHNRKSPFPERYAQQKEHLKLPIFPTTTIGSFPQTKEIRIQRNKFTKGEITAEEYEEFIEKEIQEVVKIQDELNLDVYVHGEPERNDMVQYFGERLDGYDFTTHGWVQSYGSRCVRPPIIVGDISRPAPMTVKESKYAASISNKPMKGMLTGPITCLRWSFPRDDVHQSVQAQQLALALRDEVVDLEAAGIYVIQVDEPALREGLPLRSGRERENYLSWAVDSFKLSTAGVKDSTQIHSHFCYSEFQDFFHAIAALDADVLSIENSKSDAKLLKVFVEESYPRHIGPGVYDIHSPRVPSEQEIKDRIEEMLQYLKPDQLWVNPDCGLKTRQWKETKAALTNMVNAAIFYREKYSKSS
ncbi:5-methyltetrahydropteroyltriglutamate-homocysteine methyltransferase [Coniosporium apollinis CBS 100218]|uniref:5-methyltetrahydropteroyltriglutamate--homocysteine S-methyltransferase n=1 Tax=Coniosporium apollinis (strain CBS 100218) TaxID=1168221 RepID=R7YLP5_CONA1|nr:5-methyltetrahydropteroyltriglutamate-homocysteine methyltransferase [Coniosporium apollinis CBS 100218]EON62798.1 5-methyltetrahydropteroyltriglutamate-homocysteine methyltransferase [Coniosporium apollinis CBS 100218]